MASKITPARSTQQVQNEIYIGNIEKTVYQQYTQFQQSAPFFLNYYNLVIDASTVDPILLTEDNVTGGASPLRFKKYSNFPLFNIEPTTGSFEATDLGLELLVESTAVIVPNTIIPQIGDILSTNTTSGFVFKVTAVTETYFSDNHKYYKIDFEKYQYDESLLNIIDHLNTEYTKTSIKFFDSLTDINLLKETYDSALHIFIDTFYDKRQNVFLFNGLSSLEVNEFMRMNDLCEFFTTKPFSQIFLDKNHSLLRASMLQYMNLAVTNFFCFNVFNMTSKQATLELETTDPSNISFSSVIVDRNIANLTMAQLVDQINILSDYNIVSNADLLRSYINLPFLLHALKQRISNIYLK